MQGVLRAFCTRLLADRLLIALHKLLATLFKKIDINFVPEIFIRKFIDNICFSNLPGPCYFQGASAGIIFPFQKLAVNFSLQIHKIAPFSIRDSIIPNYTQIIQ